MILRPRTSKTKPKNIGMLIVCEDTSGNYFYLQDKVNSRDVTSALVFPLLKNSDDAKGTQPHKIVEYALLLTKEENQKYHNEEAEEDENFYKEVYCIVDVDDNIINGSLVKAQNKVEEAKLLNEKITYHLLISNECFEIWYILHFYLPNIPFYRGTKTQKRANLIEDDKRNVIEKVIKRLIHWHNIPTSKKPSNKELKAYKYFFTKVNELGSEANAIQNAKELVQNSVNTFPFDNPSTTIYELIERLNKINSL